LSKETFTCVKNNSIINNIEIDSLNLFKGIYFLGRLLIKEVFVRRRLFYNMRGGFLMKKRLFIATAIVTCFTLVAGIFAFKGDKSDKVNAASNSLLAYTNAVGKMGTCINLHQLRDSNTLNGLKKHYNSITLENENKPDAILGGSARLISVADAKKKGYFIPSNYREGNVPDLNFSTVDEVLKICKQNGLSYRAHTLVWHAQTPSWFFKQGYNGGRGNVSQAEMDARLEFYVKSVMNHIYDNQNGSVCYAWDVANEYIHANNSGWQQIYGGVNTRPEFLKKAFTFAKQVLNQRGLSNNVKLFYNDYNTYMDCDKIISMVNFINGSGKVCDGVGMQSHLSTDFPSVDYYMSALDKFIKQGYEVQITELDCKGKNEGDQANYMYNLMKRILQAKKNGGKITGITYWGLYDSVSWRGSDNALLFRNSMSTPKQSYHKVIQAYDDVYGSGGGGQATPAPSNNNQPSANNLDGTYYIQSASSGMYLDVEDGKTNNGANIRQWSYNGSNAQKFRLFSSNDGYYHICTGATNYNSSVDVDNNSTQNGANILQWSRNGGKNQKFKFVKNNDGTFTILTAITDGKSAFDVYNKGTKAGDNIVQWTSNGGTNQKWKLIPAN